MTDTLTDLRFEPVNMGQALGVLADVVGCYVSNAGSAAIEDKTAQAQLSLLMFMHSLLMKSKDKAKMADLLDIISEALRDAAKAETDNPARPTSSDS